MRTNKMHSMSSLANKIFLRTVIVLVFYEEVLSLTYSSIFWSEHNYIFDKDHGEQCLNVLPQSKLPIICPFPSLVLKTRNDEVSSQSLHENLIMVDKYGYDNCIYDKTKPKNTTRYLCGCENPEKLSKYIVIFQSFSASIDGLEFTPGKYYYFISTANGAKDSLNSTSNGHCNGEKNRLKLKVYVCHNQEDCDRNTDCTFNPQNVDIEVMMGKRSSGEKSVSSFGTLAIIIIVVLAIILVISLGANAVLLKSKWKNSRNRTKQNHHNGNSKHTNPIGNGTNELNNVKGQRLPKGSESSYPFIDRV